MFERLSEFNWAVFHTVVFSIIVVGVGFVFSFISGIVQGVFHAIVSRIKSPSPEQTCAYCPRRRRKGQASCHKCGKSLP